MAVSPPGQSSLVQSLAALLRNNGDVVLDGSSTLTLPAAGLQRLTRLFEQHLLNRGQQHGFLALPSHPADTASLLQLQFLFDVLQKTVSLKLISPAGERLASVVKIFPFKSLKCLELKRVPPHLLEGLRGVYSQLQVFICSKSLSSPEELLSQCGGDLSSALPWLELHTLRFSYNYIVCLDQSLSLLNVLKSLDLSHNKIQDCAEFLKPLSELEYLNLGYNRLQRAPTLSACARSKLQTLILRNNELETINGVEQLSFLQHLDLAYNLLLDHAQLAPLSLLHALTTLVLEGNPLYYQKTHRTSTVKHLSLKAATVRLRLDGTPLTSSELSVLPKSGPLLVPVQLLPAVALAAERSNTELSSGAGDLTDSVAEVAVSSFRKKKSRSRVKVRRASISEPSDTDFEPRTRSSSKDLVLVHQQEIERMSSFREQLGEDWLRYQHHLDGSDASNQPTDPSHPNGPSAAVAKPAADSAQRSTSADLPETFLPPALPPEPSSGEQDLETESTLQWLSHSTLHTGSTADGGVPDDSIQDFTASRETTNQDGTPVEEEDGLGVDLCRPLLVGVVPEEQEKDPEAEESAGRQVFLRVKQGLLLEVDMQSGAERCRLELDCLGRVESTEATWGSDSLLPAVELHFDYISKAKRRRRYVLLDDDPQEAAQVLSEILRHVVEENQRRVSELVPGGLRLQCLRCRSEFTSQGGGAGESDGGGGSGGEEQEGGADGGIVKVHEK